MNNLTLITGHPRSGTGYTAKLLQALGKGFRHESLGIDGTVSWLHASSGKIDVTWFPEFVPKIHFNAIYHQIRDPLKVISSSVNLDPGAFDYMAQFIDIPDTEDFRLKAMYTWTGWNKIIEKQRDWFFRVEDFETVFDEFCFRLGIDKCKLPSIPKDTNTRGKVPQLSWYDLEQLNSRQADRVYEFAEKYKYV